MIWQSPKWLKAGFFIRIYNAELNKNEFWWLEEEETLTKYNFGRTAVEGYQFGAILAGQQSGFQEVQNIEPHENHFYQLLMGFRSPGHFYREIPTGTYYGGLDARKRDTPDYREIAALDQHDSPFRYPSWVTELFMEPKRRISINVYNPTGKTIWPEVRFIGKMFQWQKVVAENLIRRLKAHEIPFRPITIGILRGKGKRS